MEEGACEFGIEEKNRLAEGMAPKEISTIEDETFHPETCLVAIEPVSNYILLEEYASGRKADDWTSALQEGTKGLNVEVIQVTSDEGRGIVSLLKMTCRYIIRQIYSIYNMRLPKERVPF